MSDATPSEVADQQVLMTRVFDAPREEVFRAWIDPDALAAWYGPAHVEIPRDTIHIDPRVGGRWELTMVMDHGGREMPLGYEIVEFVEPELLVMRSDPMPHVGMPDGTLLRVELHDQGDGTRMILSDGPYPARGSGQAEAGWTDAFGKLAAHVAG